MIAGVVVLWWVSEWQSEPYIDVGRAQAWRFMDGMVFIPYSGDVAGNIARLDMSKEDGANRHLLQTHLDHEVGYWSTSEPRCRQATSVIRNARGQVLVSLMDRLKAWGESTGFWLHPA